LDPLEEVVCTDVNEYEPLEVIVRVPWFVKVANAEGLKVGRREAEKEGCEVVVFDTDVDPVLVLDLKGVADWLGESVPVLDEDIEPETDCVEVKLPVELCERVLVVEGHDDTDGDEVGELVEHGDIVSDSVCEADPVYEAVSIAEFDGLGEIDGAEVTVI